MRMLLEFDDSKAEFVRELLKGFRFIKAVNLTTDTEPSSYKAEVLQSIRKGVDELNQAKEGKLEGMSMDEFLKSV